MLTSQFSEELFYQLGLRQFGDMSKIKLHPPPPLRTLVEVAVEAEAIPSETENGKPLNKADIVQVRYSLLSFDTRDTKMNASLLEDRGTPNESAGYAR